MKTIVAESVEFVYKNAISRVASGENIGEIAENMLLDLKEFGRKLLSEIIEETDRLKETEPKRKQNWQIERKNQRKTIATTLGDVEYCRTYYRHKTTNECAFLADIQFGLTPHQKIAEDLEKEILTKTIDLSYAKSAPDFTRQTAKNIVHNTNNTLLKKWKIDKIRKIRNIYISADEDHVAMQDGTNKMQYLAYVYEGRKENGRLKNVRYFTQKQGNHEDFWVEIANFVYEQYDIDFAENIFISGDGAAWIKEAMNWFEKEKMKWVIDKFHVCKYIKSGTMWLKTEGLKLDVDIWGKLEKLDKNGFIRDCEVLLKNARLETQAKRVLAMKKYILNNWDGIKNGKNADYHGCSAEGHVSHILSDRLSSRPKGWSVDGADKIANLRAFRANGGQIGEVVHLQNLANAKIRKLDFAAQIRKNLTKHKKVVFEGTKLPILESGKNSQSYRLLHDICYNWDVAV